MSLGILLMVIQNTERYNIEYMPLLFKTNASIFHLPRKTLLFFISFHYPSVQTGYMNRGQIVSVQMS